VLIELVELRHRLLNDAPSDAHAAHKTPVAVNFAVLLARRVAQVYASFQSRRQRKSKPSRSVLHAKTVAAATQVPDPLAARPTKPSQQSSNCASWASRPLSTGGNRP
jgi:hypothetical protein